MWAVVELVDTRDGHSRRGHTLCGFECRPPHTFLLMPSRNGDMLTMYDRYGGWQSSQTACAAR